jgi:hypothetical protein
VVEDLKGFDNLAMKAQLTNYYHSDQKPPENTANIFETERY